MRPSLCRLKSSSRNKVKIRTPAISSFTRVTKTPRSLSEVLAVDQSHLERHLIDSAGNQVPLDHVSIKWNPKSPRLSRMNEELIRYYKDILPPSELQALIRSLQTPLPFTFRINPNRSGSLAEVRKMLSTRLKPSVDQVEGDSLNTVNWLPNELLWCLDSGKTGVHKHGRHSFLTSYVEAEHSLGNIWEHDAASSIPAYLLSPLPSDIILDIHSTPESTISLIDHLHQDGGESITNGPTGLLISNNPFQKQIQEVIRQVGKLTSTATMCTNLYGAYFPNLTFGPGEGAFKYDKILVSPPSSGDGDLRKNSGQWATWSPHLANAFHTNQLTLLLRALDLLKPGGRLVYTTRSMNPVENEAVICAALNAFTDVSIADCSSTLPDLKRSPGLTFWTPYEKEYLGGLETLEKMDIYYDGILPDSVRVPNEGAEGKGLENAWRVYPHLNDTSGIFVAVLEKATRQIAASESIQHQRISTSWSKGASGKQQEDIEAHPNAVVVGEDPYENTELMEYIAPTHIEHANFRFADEDDTEVQSCIEHFGINRQSFPTHLLNWNKPLKEMNSFICVMNEKMKALLTHNDINTTRLYSAGGRLFNSTTSLSADKRTSSWKVLSKSVQVIGPHISPSRLVYLGLQDLRKLTSLPRVDAGIFDKEAFEKLQVIPDGSGVAVYNAEARSGIEPLYLPLWKEGRWTQLLLSDKMKLAIKKKYVTDFKTVEGKDSVLLGLIEQRDSAFQTDQQRNGGN